MTKQKQKIMAIAIIGGLLCIVSLLALHVGTIMIPIGGGVQSILNGMGIPVHFTEPITAGIFVSISAWASYQRSENETPYWRTLKASGELNPKYPGGIDEQRLRLEAEGHTILSKGRTNVKYYVKDYENVLFELT